MGWNTIEIKITRAEGSQVFDDCYHWCHDWITWIIEFLANKPLYDYVPDPFPGGGHARLAERVVTYVLRVEPLATGIKKLDRRLYPSEVSDCLICRVQRAKV